MEMINQNSPDEELNYSSDAEETSTGNGIGDQEDFPEADGVAEDGELDDESGDLSDPDDIEVEDELDGDDDLIEDDDLDTEDDDDLTSDRL